MSCVRGSVTLFKRTLKMSSRELKQASKQASRQAGKQASRQAGKQASRQASKQASRQALGRHSVGAMPWRGLFNFDLKFSEVTF